MRRVIAFILVSLSIMLFQQPAVSQEPTTEQVNAEQEQAKKLKKGGEEESTAEDEEPECD